MKKILFVINTLGCAGAEITLIELFRRLSNYECELYLYVIMGQGELIQSVPSFVTVLNSRYDDQSVLTGKGRRKMIGKVCKAFFRNGHFFRKIKSIAGNLFLMIKRKKVQIDKLLWRVMAEGAERFEQSFDVAVAWLEGGASYYVADHVRAHRKVAFIHIDYESAGYTREMDEGCFAKFNKIMTVSNGVKKSFLTFYPELEERTEVFYNFIDYENIINKSKESGGFSDTFEGLRLLSVGRLTWQKGYDIAINAMKILKDRGYRVRWYVLGEGDQRKALEKKIKLLKLEKDFCLLGMVDNPYPYYVQADLYVHVTRFEGKSIALQEAQVLGCAAIVSDCNGNRDQIVDGEDGILCKLTPLEVAESIIELYKDENKRKKIGKAAQRRKIAEEQDLQIILDL